MRRSPPCWFFINFSWEFIHGMKYVIVVQQLKCLDFFPPGNPDYFVFIYLSWFFLKWFYFSSQLAYLERFKKFRYLFFQVMYKLLVPLLRCEVPDMRDSVINGLYFLVYIIICIFISAVCLQFLLIFDYSSWTNQSQCYHGFDVWTCELYSWSYWPKTRKYETTSTQVLL